MKVIINVICEHDEIKSQCKNCEETQYKCFICEKEIKDLCILEAQLGNEYIMHEECLEHYNAVEKYLNLVLTNNMEKDILI